MVLVDHTQASQGFSDGLSVGIWEAKASGGDEPGVHVRVAGVFFPRRSSGRTEECPWSRTPGRCTPMCPQLQRVPG